ncbi:MAG: ComEC/Rec2 family competence protein [Acetobacterium sp.]
MRNIKKYLGILVGVIFIFSLIGCSSTAQNTTTTNGSQQTETNQPATNDTTPQNDNTTTVSPGIPAVTGEIKVHFIDVGQADCILVQQGNSNMLIDAGNNEDAQTIKSYLDSLGVTALDVVIGTHAHEDHIGSMDTVIDSFPVGEIIFPKQTETTNTFKDFVMAVKNKGLTLTEPSVGSAFNIGEATVTILAPNGTGYDDANDYSVVVKVAYGNTSFLLTGDAEAASESQMVSNGSDLSATVLKVGHHGSRSSTSDSFLDKVNPKFAVISVGKGNSYGHPTQEVMNRLQARGIPVYRTDENGTIVATSNGNDVTFNTDPGSYNGMSSESTESATPESASVSEPVPVATPSEDQSVTVYTTNTGTKYHVDGCTYLSKSKIPISLGDAKAKGLTPCSKCQPPQ